MSIRLAGILDEDNHLANLTDKVGSGQAVINLGDVEYINSCGARDWVKWIGQLEARGIWPVLAECSLAFVAQLNLVKNFSGSAVVKSFYAPYHCPQCDKDRAVLIEVSELGPPPYEAPTCRCDECDTLMNFDDIPGAYFAFLRSKQHTPAVPLRPVTAKGSDSAIEVRAAGSEPIRTMRAKTPSPSVVRADSQPAPAPEPPAPPRAETVEVPQKPVWPWIAAFSLGLILAIAGLAYLVATV